MRLQWSHILVPLSVGVACSVLTTAATWTEVSQTLLGAVSIVSAGVLVRLARGVPFSAIDVLNTEEARKLAYSIKKSVRALRALLLVCFVAVLSLVFIKQIEAGFTWLASTHWLPFSDHVDYVSLTLPFILSFVFMRTYAVVDGDIQIADIQADILIRKRGKDAADAFKKNVAGPAKESFRQPSGYGGVVEGEKV